MRSPRYVSLLEDLVAAAREPRVLEEIADERAATALLPTLDAPWKHLKSALDQASEDPSDASLHGARIRAKRVRYAAEAVTPVFGKRAANFAKAAADLQEVLGEHQDSVVARAGSGGGGGRFERVRGGRAVGDRGAGRRRRSSRLAEGAESRVAQAATLWA